jgi:hypothetical protein
MEAKLEHLKMIQDVIARMAGNSFLLKGWTVTLVAALFAFAAKDAERSLVIIAWIPLLVFAGLDAYYLLQERLFRRLYDQVAMTPGAPAPQSDAAPESNFSMSVEPFKTAVPVRDALFSATILGFYVPMCILVAVVTVYLVLNPAAKPIPVQGPKTITISIQ